MTNLTYGHDLPVLQVTWQRLHCMLGACANFALQPLSIPSHTYFPGQTVHLSPSPYNVSPRQWNRITWELRSLNYAWLPPGGFLLSISKPSITHPKCHLLFWTE
ncbi:hypothetical protein FKM82_024907 [Ascaphus truei]